MIPIVDLVAQYRLLKADIDANGLPQPKMTTLEEARL